MAVLKFIGGGMFNPKVFVAEFIGTFALVFVGAAAGLYQLGILGVALAHGLTLAAFIYVFGHISGTHVNPAVTLGLAANGNIKWSEAIVYWVAQLSGASLAAFLLKTFIGVLDPNNTFAGIATTGLLTANYTYYALGLEALLTFFLVNAVLHAAVDGKAGQFAGLAIGTTLTIGILAGAPLTGGSLNPARSFGPALFTSTIDASRLDVQNPLFYLVYFVGPFVGAVLAVILYRFFKYEFVTSEDIDDDENEEEVVIVVEEPKEKPARKPAARKSTVRKTTKK
jgi:MIP family channel proteins